jgi:mRNA-degrading endonuclease RelE of RelBE toxin-antitoxin system
MHWRGRTREDAQGVLWIGDAVDTMDYLKCAWDPGFIPPLYSRGPLVWSIGLSSDFKKAIATIDKKLQGRVLEALSAISDAPLQAHGDTQKPLGGQLKGLWRRRVGDYRLVYKPDISQSKVILVDFSSRGGVYD